MYMYTADESMQDSLQVSTEVLRLQRATVIILMPERRQRQVRQES